MSDNIVQVDIIGKVNEASFNKAKSDAESILNSGNKEIKLNINTDALKKIEGLSGIPKTFDTEIKIDQTQIVDAKNKILELKAAMSDLKNASKQGLISSDVAGPQMIGLKENLVQAQREFKNLVATGDEGTSRLQNKFGALGEVVGQTFGRIRSYAEFLTATLIIGGVTSLIKSVFSLTSQNQLLEQSFTSLTGSAEESRRILQEISDIAVKTPFNRLELAQNTQRMIAYGMSADQALFSLKRIADATAALGGTQDVFNRVSLAIGQMFTKGKISGEEIRQLAEAGIPALAILKEKLNLTEKDIQKIGNAGITSAEGLNALFEGLNERFGGASERASTTLSGRLSNIKDKFQLAVIEFGNSIGTLLENVVGVAERLVSETLPVFLAIFSSVLDTASQVFGQALDGWRAVFNLIATGTAEAEANQKSFLTRTGEGLYAFITVLGAGIKAIVLSIKVIGMAIGAFAAGIVGSWRELMNVFVLSVLAIPETLYNVFAAIGLNISSSIADGVNKGIAKINEFITFVNGLNIPSVNFQLLKSVEGGGKSASWGDLMPTITGGAIEKQLEPIKNSFSSAFSTMNETITSEFGKTAEDIQKSINVFGNIESGKSSSSVKTPNDDLVKFLKTNNLDSGGGKTAEQKAKKEYDLKKKQLDNELELELASSNNLVRTAEEREKMIAAIKLEYKNKDIQLKKDILGETLGFSDMETQKAINGAKQIDEYNKKLFDEGKTGLEKIGKKIEDSTKLMDGYGNKIEDAKKKFDDLKTSALRDLSDINNKLSDLGKEKSTDLGNRFAEATKEYKELLDMNLKPNYEGRTEEENQRMLDLQKEIELITKNTTAEERAKGIEISKQSDAEKIILKYKQEEAVLLERKKINEAIQKGVIGGDDTIATVGGKLSYVDAETGAIVEITDTKNKQYALDTFNKKHQLDLEYENYVNLLNDESKALKKSNEEKIALEEDFSFRMGGILASRTKDLEAYTAKMTEVGTTLKALAEDLKLSGIDMATVANIANASGMSNVSLLTSSMGNLPNVGINQSFNFTFNGQTINGVGANALTAASQYIKGGGSSVDELKRVVELASKGIK